MGTQFSRQSWCLLVDIRPDLISGGTMVRWTFDPQIACRHGCEGVPHGVGPERLPDALDCRFADYGLSAWN